MEDRLPGEGLAELVELGDPAALLRAVDGLCASRDWAGLVDLRQRLEEAVERGRPLWPVTTYVEYRMALDGPASEAASVLRPGAARFALGPLTEVAATTHTFAELARTWPCPRWPGPSPRSGSCAARTCAGPRRPRRGAGAAAGAGPVGAGLRAGQLPARRARGPDPAPRRWRWWPAGPSPARSWTGPRSPGPSPTWSRSGPRSRGRGALVVSAARPRRWPPSATASTGWAGWRGLGDGPDGLGGGQRRAHGVRRGAALGRLRRLVGRASLAGLDWPPDPDALGAAVERLAWWVWDDGMPGTGWILRLVAADPGAGWAAALDATDHS